MSLVGTLGKLALGAIAAKGIGKLMSGSGQGGGSPLGGLLGSMTGGGQQGGGGLGALGGLLGGLGGQQGAGGASGLGGILDALGGGQQGGGASGSLGGLLNQALGGQPAAQVEASSEQDQQAEILMRAMISAAKADGEIDDGERAKITEQLGDDVTPDELELVRSELAAPLDVDGLINSVPQGMEQQVYLMSLLAIDLDSQPEAIYLDKLAKGLNISQQQANAIHDQLGAPKLYG